MENRESNPGAPGENPSPESDFPALPDLPRAAELLVIDDVDGWFGKPGNMLSAADLARVVQRLNELARELHVAIVVLVAAQLSVEGRITSRQLSRLSHAASVVWMVVRDREGGTERWSDEATEGQSAGTDANDEGRMTNDEWSADAEPLSNPKSKIENPKSYSQSARRWFLPVKNNVAPDAATFGRAFEIVDGQIRWHGDDPAPSLAEALLPSTHNTDRRRLRHAAAAFIQEALAAGPLPSKELYQQGIDNGFTKGTLKRAATELGIHPHKTGFNGGWEMRWVEQPVVRGRGSPARAAGSGFKVYGGEGKAEGKRQKAEAIAGRDASCASSLEHEEPSLASCASSLEHEESPLASCASSVEYEESSLASCASSAKREESCGASCASSAKREESCGASCASSPPPIPTPTLGPEPKETDSEQRLDVYAVVVDALREACFKEAC